MPAAIPVELVDDGDAMQQIVVFRWQTKYTGATP